MAPTKRDQIFILCTSLLHSCISFSLSILSTHPHWHMHPKIILNSTRHLSITLILSSLNNKNTGQKDKNHCFYMYCMGRAVVVYPYPLNYYCEN